jgi:putative ABC transport system permease protein
VMRIPLLHGRFFTDQDGPDAARVAILSESCARWQFPHEDPVGRRISIDGGQHWMTVIGVVSDVLQHGMDDGPSAGVYCPQAQYADFYYRMAVRTSGDPWRIYPAVRAAMREIDPNQPMFHVQPMNDYVTKSLANRIFALWLIGILGALALALAAIGVYGVVSYSVSLRTRELGVRIALGAGREDVLWLVLQDLLRAIGLGLGIGLITELALARSVAHLLYGVPAGDPVTLFTAALILTGVALLAAFVPCRRAFLADPSATLRQV